MKINSSKKLIIDNQLVILDALSEIIDNQDNILISINSGYHVDRDKISCIKRQIDNTKIFLKNGKYNGYN